MFASPQGLVPFRACRFLSVYALFFSVGLLDGQVCLSQNYVIVQIDSANSDEPIDNADLARRVLQDLGADHYLIIENIGMQAGSSPSEQTYDRAIALIKIESPETINSTSTQTRNSIKATRLSPVYDFEAFCDAIDYATIIDRNSSKRYVKLRIPPEELEEDKLKSRARRKDRASALHGLFEDNSSMKHRFGKNPMVDKMISSALGTSTLGVVNDFTVGDQIEIEISDGWYGGSVVSLLEDDKIKIQIEDTKALANKVTNRRLKTDLRRAKQFSMITPVSYLRLVERGNAAGITEREWKDATGRFSITGTYVSEEAGKVKIEKPDGKTLTVPLKKLSAIDQAYVERIANGVTNPEPENPFAEAPKPILKQIKRLEADRSRVQEIDNSGFDNWYFIPPKITAQRSDQVVSMVDLEDLPDSKRFFEKIERLDISTDGTRALVSRKKGHVGTSDDSPFLQFIDTVRGRATQLIQGPKKSVVLDSLPERSLVMLRSDVFSSSKKTQLYVYKVTSSGIKPVLEWKPYEATRQRGSRRSDEDVDEAWFLSNNRILTTTSGGRLGTIWKLGKQAVAEFEFDSDVRAGLHIVVGPNRRLFALCSNAGISIIDSQEGRLIGVIPSPDDRPMHFFNVGDTQQVAFSNDMRRVSVVRQKALGTWDLATGEMISEIWNANINFSSSIMWIGDYLLVDGQYVFDPERRVLLWNYKNGKDGHRGKSCVAASRLWYVPQADDNLTAHLGSVPIPDSKVIEAAESLGSPESLLLAQPGDKVSIRIEVEPQYASEEFVRSSVTKRLAAAGYIVVQGNTPLVAIATCKTLPRQEIRINLSKNRFNPDDWDIITKSVVPKASGISLELDGKPIWSTGSVSRIWQRNIYLEKGETLDDALERLSSVNIERVLKENFPTHVAKAGDVGNSKAYGESYLDEE